MGIARQHPAPPVVGDKPNTPVTAPPSANTSDLGKTQPPALPTSEPVKVSIPAIKVSSALESLGLDEHQAMETPKDPAKAGWYQPGPTPGAEGPAVIAGHVTYNGIPGVFFKLAELNPGNRIEVTREDRRVAVFTVERIATYAKDHFPTVEVYRNLDHAGLRLITCGGTYSKAEHRYADNVVVYASLTSTR
ncbi:sortase [Streptomyces sp. 150FB]|uniref:class F sortase n=1 Tax=Streptomyces sp. 150FB TaxID=1576605 RepID=UPI000588FF15|nr:class F sortase [Streptomyces sp. 150FB]KIF77872.1 sortase [Streptomyces sp. 150FB]